jgi:hypothetical protein
MMIRTQRAIAALAATGLLLTGCASAHTATTSSTPAGATESASAMRAGMVMPDGSTMGAISSTAPANSAVPGAGVPSAAERMICAAETHTTIVQILGLPATPASTATWRDHLYTCTYRLPMGTLIVSVKQSSSPARAQQYFYAQRTRLAPTHHLDGLGQRSYGTTSGTVVLIKDSDVLTVDTTRLPTVFGNQGSKRFDFAYELASDILGCWTEG